MVAIVIPSEYGYVLGAYVVNALHLFYLGINVSKARKAAKLPYPYVYFEKSEAEKAAAEKDLTKNVFNCTQRVHQNSLETFPIYTALTLVGGLQYPEIAAGAGLAYFLGRAAYASGYSTGSPDKRVKGALFSYAGLIALLGASGLTLKKLIMN